MIKKTILMLLVLVGGVVSANATDYYVGANTENNGNGWAIKGQMTDDDNDGTYSFILNIPARIDNGDSDYFELFYFTIFTGSTIANDWSNAYRPKDGEKWITNSICEFEMIESNANNNSIVYANSWGDDKKNFATALRIDYTPQTKMLKATRLITVASGYNKWNTEIDYLTETANGSKKYQGRVALEKESTDVADGYKFIIHEWGWSQWIGIKDNKMSYTEGSNATVDVDGLYDITVDLSSFENGTTSWPSVELVTVSATLGAYGYTTFASEYPLNLDNITNATAYYVSQTPTNSVKLVQTSGTVQAGEGLVLYGETSNTEVTIPVAINGSAISGNLLVGCPEATDITTSTPGYASIYVLVNTDSRAEFQNVKNWLEAEAGRKVSIPAGKAYLNASGVSAPSFSLEFDDETTGIANIERIISDNQYYTLDGRRVAQPTKGLYIVNGKKVIIK